MIISLSNPHSPFLLLFFFFFFTILTLHSLTVTSATCHVDDETGLLGFKSSITADPSGILSSWKPGSDCCTWSGITCLVSKRVTSLYLMGQSNKPNSFLSGPISPSLSKLKFLDGLYLRNLRNISGPFPDFLFGLPEFKYIYIDNNKLSGRIPGSIGNLTRLYSLSLSDNQFSGPIPSSISQLTGLTQLNLGGNRLTGPIPNGIQKLKNLTLFSLDRNQLSGSIPDFSDPSRSSEFSGSRTTNLPGNSRHRFPLWRQNCSTSSSPKPVSTVKFPNFSGISRPSTR
ncbi:hypothetical protein CMV_029083 [Castanea mollissima]|uniref:Leucine-rich repeat-containing N-terminal plant-type domain-containing protein n=1 Tax=Castanea mollissima TaxID=60419 RepID=A0A8J4Q722_9ROSI|nr:hypothetical protein CMV_029083 [Castanea mollissima]